MADDPLDALRGDIRRAVQGAPPIHIPESGPGECRSARHVPELRNWMVRQWAPSGMFTNVTDFTYRMNPSILYADHDRPGSGRKDLLADAHGSRTALQRAALYFVEPSMVDLLTTVAPSTPDDVRPVDLTLPHDEGLMVFARPVVGTASDLAYPVEVHAIVWHLSTLPNHVDSLSVENYRRGWPLEDRPDEQSRQMESIWFPLGRSDWPLVDTLATRPFWATKDSMWQSFLEDRQLVAAAFTLLAEEGVTSRVIERADRHTHKRAEREGVTGSSDVVVATLRAPHSAPATEPSDSPTHRTHRWLVREHLRWARVGKGRTERRLTVVRAHVRGPADAPLVMKDKVNRWVR